ncbi:MAG: Ldh family oxidoreductase [Ideonella sp.]|nr:Ldh family oxidoreductase [Ideonella sp.]
MQFTTVSVEELERVMSGALWCHGASEFAANEVAKALRRAEQRGNTSCGLGHLEGDCAQLRSGRVAGQAMPVVHRPRPGLVHVDADSGFAHPAFAPGLPEALDSVEALGVSVLAVSRAHTCAALGYFPDAIADHGYIGLAVTNASASVAAPGGSKPLLGTNPIAMAVPDGKGGMAFQFDQCTSAANLRHVREAAERSEAIPEGWAVSADGSPTTNPIEALAGALLPAGGSRGFGIGLMSEVLASFFTNSAMSLDTANLRDELGPPHRLGVFCLLLDPMAIAGDHLACKVEKLRSAIDTQPKTRLPGTQRVAQPRVPVDSVLWRRAQFLASRPLRPNE